MRAGRKPDVISRHVPGKCVLVTQQVTTGDHIETMNSVQHVERFHSKQICLPPLGLILNASLGHSQPRKGSGDQNKTASTSSVSETVGSYDSNGICFYAEQQLPSSYGTTHHATNKRSNSLNNKIYSCYCA